MTASQGVVTSPLVKPCTEPLQRYEPSRDGPLVQEETVRRIRRIYRDSHNDGVNLIERMVTIENVSSEEVTEVTKKVFKILDRYFRVLENGTSVHILPNPLYQWRHETTLREMRDLLGELDQYWLTQRDHSSFQGLDAAGPDLSRLPNDAVRALAEELDAVL